MVSDADIMGVVDGTGLGVREIETTGNADAEGIDVQVEVAVAVAVGVVDHDGATERDSAATGVDEAIALGVSDAIATVADGAAGSTCCRSY